MIEGVMACPEFAAGSSRNRVSSHRFASLSVSLIKHHAFCDCILHKGAFLEHSGEFLGRVGENVDADRKLPREVEFLETVEEPLGRPVDHKDVDVASLTPVAPRKGAE